MAVLTSEMERKLFSAADDLRANAKLKSHEYATPVLGLIFLKYADYKFTKAKVTIEREQGSSRRTIGPIDYQKHGVLYVPETARYSYLLTLPEGADVSDAVNQAMKDIEEANPDLKGVLPKNYRRIPKEVLTSLMKTFSSIEIPEDNGDTFGAIYEYFLGEFALNEGQKGGEFYTPISIVRLIVEVLEPYRGLILDPACGSGGMFVQSAKFVDGHKGKGSTDISIYGQEKITDTVKLCKMNLAVHGLTGDIREANTFYENVHKCVNRFDFVMANPPFNVKGVDKERIKGDKRFPFGLPSNDNANYIWIQEFYSALNETGKAGFVMANSSSDARHSELEIRKNLIQDKVVDVMISIGPNMFYTVALPCTLWFFDKGKRNTDRGNKVLFIDARGIFTQVDRAHREFSPDQIEGLANIVRAYHERSLEFDEGSREWFSEKFPEEKYVDVPGLCRVATIEEIEAQGWSLNPGRYVGNHLFEDNGSDYKSNLQSLVLELQDLNTSSKKIASEIVETINRIISSS